MSATVYYVVQIEEGDGWRDWTRLLRDEADARAEYERAQGDYSHKGWRVVRRMFTEDVLP